MVQSIFRKMNIQDLDLLLNGICFKDFVIFDIRITNSMINSSSGEDRLREGQEEEERVRRIRFTRRESRGSLSTEESQNGKQIRITLASL
jgi:hypothetical protein